MCFFGFTAHRKRTATQKRRAGKWKSDGVVGGRAVRAFLHRCDELFGAQNDEGVNDG